MALQFSVRDKENLASNGPRKRIQKQEKAPGLQKSKSGLQQRNPLSNITNTVQRPATAVPVFLLIARLIYLL